ncbi:photosystem II protein, Psb35-related [Synechococcus sp. PCC 7336]|uniref:photosystem II protein, Psb35-related n=1 Tax=Synechococcus sp. PCC 7336 TaxID=195250 RepID=UPI0003485FE1|nr:hypothetical protein [Synechococcus sp. PCC 7336]
MVVIALLFLAGFVAAITLGTQAYFRGEQTKPIHWRNWKSEEFHRLAESLTGVRVNYEDRASTPYVQAALNEILVD